MSNLRVKRVPLIATYDVKEHWSRMLFDQFEPGGYLSDLFPEFGREHLLFALLWLRAVNGHTGKTFMGAEEVANALGYTGNGHPGYKARKMLDQAGFLTRTGKTRGRSQTLELSVPVDLLDKYETLANSTRKPRQVQAESGETVHVSTQNGSKPTRESTEDVHPRTQNGAKPTAETVAKVEGRSWKVEDRSSELEAPSLEVEQETSSTPTHPATAPSNDPWGDNDPFSDPVGSPTAGSTTTAPRSGNGSPDDLGTGERERCGTCRYCDTGMSMCATWLNGPGW